MNDIEIRQSFHKKRLKRHHANKATLVIDELGLNHGRCRADIAVVNGHLVGYEIKSDSDSLRRLEEQVISYNSVFDRAFVIVGERYAESVKNYVPHWWGVILSTKGPRGGIDFRSLRKAQRNDSVDPISIARLLWRNEAAKILQHKNLSAKKLRQPRAVLYEYLASVFSTRELQKTVREHLKKRKNWRDLESPSPQDD